MSKPVRYMGRDYREVDFTHDLTKGQRAYLKEQGVSEHSFRKMNPVDQNDWLGETKENAYEHMRRYKGK